MTNEAKSLIGIGIATLVIVVGAAFFVGGKPSATKESPKLSEDQSKILVRQDSYVKGTSDAKVTLVEFGDFQCPACGATHPVVNKLLEDYKGKVTFVFREFPLPMHKNAKSAARAAEAAGAQGKFFEMYDALYQNQQEWGESNKATEYYEKYATMIGLDLEKFKSEAGGNAYDSRIQNDINDANALGVNATPTFFINGEKVSGGLPYDEFKTKIDAALGAAK